MKKIIFIFLSIVCGFSSLAFAEAPVLDFAKANSAYRDGKYKEAIDGYEALVNSGLQSGPIFYNLANSYFKNKQLGKSVLNYQRAQKLIPRDADLAANLKFAKASIPNAVEPLQDPVRRIFSAHVNFYTTNEMVLILSLLLGLLALTHVCGLYFKWDPYRWICLILIAAFLIFLTGLFVKLDLEKDAGIMVKSSSARFEPNDKATVYFQLPEGQKVRWQIQEGYWLKIQRPDGKVGWVPLETVEKI